MSLTTELGLRDSPVKRWFGDNFPNYKRLQTEFRLAAGAQQLMRPADNRGGTLGGAIDLWLRTVFDPTPRLDAAVIGLLAPTPLGGPNLFVRAGTEFLADLFDEAVPTKPSRKPMPRWKVEKFADRDDEWWARTCYALALLIEVYRTDMALYSGGSKLNRLDGRSRGNSLRALASPAEVADLIAMRRLADTCLVPHLVGRGPVDSGMSFDGSADLIADADLVVEGILIDFKGGQGNPPTRAGTRSAKLPAKDLYQLLGYTFLDYSNVYELHSVGIYLTRFGHLRTWPLTALIEELAGRPRELAELRAEFKQLLQGL
jgi:hypothetical protein